MDLTAERAAFERQFERHQPSESMVQRLKRYPDRHPWAGAYVDVYVECAWHTWLAHRKANA